MSASTLRGQVWLRMLWSFGNLFSSVGLRFGANLLLTRLLDPHVFGIMVIVNAMRFGIELLTDVGIEQNIIHHTDGLDERFFNTAWTMQVVRGIGLCVVFSSLSPLLSEFYGIDVTVFLAVAFAPFLNGLHSTAVFGLVKSLDVKQRTLFEFKSESVGFIVTVLLATLTPTVWALIIGMLGTITFRSFLSYSLPRPPHRLVLDRTDVTRIMRFGRWIMISSIVMFAATNLDRLVLGKVAPLAILGIYGLARTMGDIPALMARKLSYQIIFPMLSAGDSEVSASFSATRLKLALGSSLVIGVGVGCADWAVAILYDPRYAQAGWMLASLLWGSLVSVLSSFNEGMLLGLGRPAYESAANLARFGLLGVGLWVGYAAAGLPGAILSIILSELGRYAVVCYGQWRTGVMMLGQDFLALGSALLVAAVWIGARVALGFGTPWATLA